MRALLPAAACLLLCLPALASALPAPAPLPSLEGGVAASAIVPRLAPTLQVQDGAGPGPAPAAPAGDSPAFALPPGPLASLVAGSARATDAEGLMAAAWDYFAAQGFDVPPSSPSEFDENSTLAFTHDVGDVDRDGVEDLALDTYCPAALGCPALTQTTDVAGAGRTSLITYCSVGHIVRIVSGATGREVWNASLDRTYDNPVAVPESVNNGGCALEFIAGTVPLPDGARGLVAYRFQILHDIINNRYLIYHDLRVMDPHAGGEPLWMPIYHQEGYYASNWLNVGETVLVAKNLVLNPILVEAPHRGVQFVSGGKGPGLFVQGVGFRTVVLTTTSFQNPPTANQPLVFVNDYQPDEWLARLDANTGSELWHRSTFVASPDRSVVPIILRTPPLADTYAPASLAYDTLAVNRVHDGYWAYAPCCFDLSGDGEPDVAAYTVEYTNRPSTNLEGPYTWDNHLLAFSGADGQTTFSQPVVQGSTNPRAPVVTAQAIGDVDGDRHDDFVLHTVFYNFTYIHVLSVRSGASGDELWRIYNPRNTEIAPIGDLDRDGGQDFLLLEWKDFEAFSTTYGDFTNITHVPLSVFSGRDGRLLWRQESYIAISDLLMYLDGMRGNGIPDLDHDGMGELPLDDPIFLPDRTVIHQVRVASPGAGRDLFHVVAAGGFATALLPGDMDGDGTDDLAFLNGDINDLWLTTYSGAAGTPLWSRRLMEARVSSYILAVPHMRVHPVASLTHPGRDLIVELQMSYSTYGGFVLASNLKEQLSGTRGANGSVLWAFPGIYSQAGLAARVGASPASELFAQALDRQAHPLAAQAGRLASLGLPGIGAFLLASLGSYFLVRRRPA
ncbi:MAG TPA: hypothetical protein VM286_07845 [Candidatus Thermoplasmatota archaeon]|nr:hypothetical protein [Candidatus Thermoplasmatota archaeon]